MRSWARLVTAAGLTWVLTLAAPAPASAQSLASALDLYAAASYDEALAALDQARLAQPSSDDLVVIERHRLLCLVALGRTAAAQDVVAGLLDARPEFVLTAGDASPRVRAVFDAARARVLPGLVRRRYADGKRAFDAGEFTAARDEFTRVTALLADPAVATLDPSAEDLRLLATGFLEVSAAAIERERADREFQEAKAAWAAEKATILASLAAVDTRPAPAVAPSTPPPVEPPPFAPITIFIYDWRDADVTPPVAESQPVSGWWGSMGEPPAGSQLGTIEVVVDETGAVTEARIVLSVTRVYDKVLLESVKQWRYQPALKDGRPVKYRRTTAVVSGH